VVLRLKDFFSAGRSPTVPSFAPPDSTPATDFVCENRGSLFLLIPRSAPAKIWIEENLPPDRMTFCDAVVIESTYVWAILQGLQDDGLTVSR
jgi:hypothetical protein